MSNGIRRETSGQFSSGQSGNPEGARRRRPRELITITDLHRIHLEVATEVVGTKDGKPVTRYENAVRMLAKGESPHRLGTRDFIETVQRAAYHFTGIARDQARRDRGL